MIDSITVVDDVVVVDGRVYEPRLRASTMTAREAAAVLADIIGVPPAPPEGNKS